MLKNINNGIGPNKYQKSKLISIMEIVPNQPMTLGGKPQHSRAQSFKRLNSLMMYGDKR